MAQGFVDWLDLTWGVEVCPQGLVAFAQSLQDRLGGGVLLERGMWGYTCAAAVLGSGRVLWTPDRPETGVHLSLPASAIGRLPTSLDAFMLDAYASGATCTRLDLATDSIGEVNIEQIDAACRCGDVVTRSRSIRVVEDVRLGGKTIYVGAAGSDTLVRFYDKRAEQESKGKEIPYADGVSWVRCELQLRHDRAHQVFTAVCAGVDCLGYVVSCVDFRDASSDSNSARRERLEWWVLWLGTSLALKFDCVSANAEVAKMRDWVIRSVACTLSVLLMADGGDLGWLEATIRDGWRRCPDWKRRLALQ